MKLLEEATSTPTPRPSGRRVWATMSITLLAVVVATFVGYSMLTSDGSERDENSPVPMSTWTQEASSTCRAVAEEHPVLTQGTSAREDIDNIATVVAGIGTLDAEIRDLPPLTDPDDQAEVDAAVALGAPASSAWENIESTDDVSNDDLAEASELTTTFVASLVDLGAECAVLN